MSGWQLSGAGSAKGLELIGSGHRLRTSLFSGKTLRAFKKEKVIQERKAISFLSRSNKPSRPEERTGLLVLPDHLTAGASCWCCAFCILSSGLIGEVELIITSSPTYHLKQCMTETRMITCRHEPSTKAPPSRCRKSIQI